MARPKGSKNRVRIAPTIAEAQMPRGASTGMVNPPLRTSDASAPHEPEASEFSQEAWDALDAPVAPPHWGRGALLNVRNTGADYVVTLFPEEYDPRSPERALRFTNPAMCQDFVSRWYMRESNDPRAR